MFLRILFPIGSHHQQTLDVNRNIKFIELHLALLSYPPNDSVCFLFPLVVLV